MASPYQEFLAKARARKVSGTTGSGAQLLSSPLVFTKHSEYKMKQYGLSLQKVRGVIRSPKRKEVGIVTSTIAVMQPVSPKKVEGKDIWKQEIWVLYKEDDGSKKIISAWRYPGVSPKREPIPEDILQELLDLEEC
jgi:hypothetical protein